MARNLLRAGHEVALWSNTAGKARQLASEEKGLFCHTPRQVAENADYIFLCVGNTDMASEVILGSDGIIHGAKPGTVVADASTISPSQSRKIGQALKAKGVDFLDAPCTGSTPGATGGTLTFMIGGDQAVFEKTKPFLETMGKRLFYCGGPGLGLAFNEGMVLATKGGVDPQLMLDILDASAAKSGLIAYKAPFVFRRDFTANFSTKWMHKDIGLMLDAGEELGVPLPLTSLTHQLFQTAIAAGHGDEDMCSTINVLEDLVGVQVKPQ
jgi:3-hydroxyisobutyrate dehydrogenase/2-hydroxy-3-oxopropionate reductase